jgi:hypothetical protein
MMETVPTRWLPSKVLFPSVDLWPIYSSHADAHHNDKLYRIALNNGISSTKCTGKRSGKEIELTFFLSFFSFPLLYANSDDKWIKIRAIQLRQTPAAAEEEEEDRPEEAELSHQLSSLLTPTRSWLNKPWARKAHSRWLKFTDGSRKLILSLYIFVGGENNWHQHFPHELRLAQSFPLETKKKTNFVEIANGVWFVGFDHGPPLSGPPFLFLERKKRFRHLIYDVSTSGSKFNKNETQELHWVSRTHKKVAVIIIYYQNISVMILIARSDII